MGSPNRRSNGRRRPGHRRTSRAFALGLGAISLTGIGAAAVWIAGDDAAPSTRSQTSDEDAQLRELVARGLIPAETLEPAADDDAQLRELVARGLIPGQALEPLLDEDAQLRDLVERGLIPAETLAPAADELDRAGAVPGNVR